jgi:hypothetical protein
MKLPQSRRKVSIVLKTIFKPVYDRRDNVSGESTLRELHRPQALVVVGHIISDHRLGTIYLKRGPTRNGGRESMRESSPGKQW